MQKQGCMDYVKKNYQVSHAQVCRLIGCSRTGKYYKKLMPEKDSKLKEIISSVIGSSRKGREKVIRLVRKKYPQISQSKLRRVYQKEGFSLYKRLKRRIRNNPANPISIPLQPNKEWAMDFMSDSLNDGRKLRTLNIVDHYNRKCLGIYIAHSIPARRVIDAVEMAIERYGKPESIRTDNGPEFRSKLFQLWLEKNNIKWSAIEKGKPQQNAIVERFNRTYRKDILDANVFQSIEEVKQITDRWKHEYNSQRPHQSLKYKTPDEYAA